MYRQLLIYLVIGFSAISALANETTPAPTPIKAQKPQANIQGNPVGKKDNYTVNSTKNDEKTVDCVFINTSAKPQGLSVWTDVKELKPTATFQLKPGSKAKPFQVMHGFRLKLEEHWWCRIADFTNGDKKWKFCSYFSISDPSALENNPFKASIEIINSKEVSYNCRIKNPGMTTSFLYLK